MSQMHAEIRETVISKYAQLGDTLMYAGLPQAEIDAIRAEYPPEGEPNHSKNIDYICWLIVMLSHGEVEPGLLIRPTVRKTLMAEAMLAMVQREFADEISALRRANRELLAQGIRAGEDPAALLARLHAADNLFIGREA